MNKEDEEFLEQEQEHSFKDDDIIESEEVVQGDGDDGESEESDLDNDMYNIDGEDNDDNDEESSGEDERAKLKQQQQYKKKRNLQKSTSSGEFKIIPYKTLKDLTPTKGILKNRTEQPPPKKNRIVWDEENLTINDMNKSSTMKIDEPKTPYHYYESEEEESTNGKKYLENKFKELQNALDKQHNKQNSSSDSDDGYDQNKKNKKKTLRIGNDDDDEDDDDEDDEDNEEKKESRKKFDNLRKAHYNEFKSIKNANLNLSDDEE